MNLAGVWIWWTIVIVTLVALIICWVLRVIPVNAALLWLVLEVILIVIGVIWFSSWGDQNSNTLQPGITYWYVSNEARNNTLDNSVVTVKVSNANNNNQLGTINMGVVGNAVTSNNISYVTSAVNKYVLKVTNNGNVPVNLVVTSTGISYSGPSRTAP